MADHGFEQGLHAAHVVVEILERLRHAFAHLDEGGEMEDRVDPVFREDPVEIFGGADIPLVEFRAGVHGFPVSGHEAVHDDHLVAALDKSAHVMGADIAGSAHYQYLHDELPGQARRPPDCILGYAPAPSPSSSGSSGFSFHSPGMGAVRSALSPT